MSLHNVCFCNEQLLSELITAINSLPADLYATPVSGDSRQTVGMHSRHIIEFYQCFFTGLTSQHINYDERNRNTDYEDLRSEGMSALKQMIVKMTELRTSASGNNKLMLTSVSDTTGSSVTIETSTERELLFLHSHTTHHMAIINLLLKQAGFTPGKELGIATSTQIYRKSQLVSS